MKTLLGILTAFATFVTLCNAQCYFTPYINPVGDVSNECKDVSGVIYPMNSKWKTENCEECSCGKEGIDCCNIIATPVNYNTDKCQKILNKETCSYTVVERKDPGKTCFVGGWVM